MDHTFSPKLKKILHPNLSKFGWLGVYKTNKEITVTWWKIFSSYSADGIFWFRIFGVGVEFSQLNYEWHIDKKNRKGIVIRIKK